MPATLAARPRRSPAGPASGRACGAPRPLADDLDEDRQHRDQHDQRDHRQDVVVDVVADGVVDLLGQQVADQDDAVGPEDRADHVPHEELAGRHAEHAGHRVEERADDRDEPGQHHGLGRAELLEVVLGLLDVLPLEEPRVGLVEHPPAVAGAEQCPSWAPSDRADRRADQQAGQGQLGAVAEDRVGHRGGRHAGQEQQRVAGEEEADQQAGLGEEDRPDAEQTEGVDQVLRVQRIEGEVLG